MKMKRFLLVLLAAFCLTLADAQGGGPAFMQTFKPVERVHDFGKIYEKKGKVVNVFRFKNMGNTPVAITEVNTWCGCMVANYTKKAVRLGETATVMVTFDPNHKSGNFVKQVVLLLNDGKNYARVWIKANVVPYQHPVTEDHPYYFGQGLYMNQQLLPFPDLKVGQTYAYNLKLANNTNKTMKIVFKCNPNNTVLKMPRELTLKPNERTSIKVSYAYFRKYKVSRYINVIPVVNGKEARALKVTWNVGNKFRLLQ